MRTTTVTLSATDETGEEVFELRYKQGYKTKEEQYAYQEKLFTPAATAATEVISEIREANAPA